MFLHQPTERTVVSSAHLRGIPGIDAVCLISTFIIRHHRIAVKKLASIACHGGSLKDYLSEASRILTFMKAKTPSATFIDRNHEWIAEALLLPLRHDVMNQLRLGQGKTQLRLG